MGDAQKRRARPSTTRALEQLAAPIALEPTKRLVQHDETCVAASDRSAQRIYETKPATRSEIKQAGEQPSVCTSAKDELREVFLQVAIYCGVPAAIDSFRVAQEVFEDMGI